MKIQYWNQYSFNYIFFFLSFWKTLFFVVPTHAQHFPRSLTVPAPSPEGGAWFSSFSLNAPSHLSRLSGWHVLFGVHENIEPSTHPWNISTETLWLAHEVPLIKAACFASGSALRDDSGYFGGILGLGCGWEASSSWAFGVRFLHRLTPARPLWDNARDWAISARFAPREDLFFTYQAESVFMHPVGGLPQERLHRLEFAWGRFNQLFAGVHLSERRLDVALSGGFRWQPLSGILLTLSAVWARRHNDAFSNGVSVQVDDAPNFTISAGLSFQLDNVAFGQSVTLPGPLLDAYVMLSSKPVKGHSLLPETDYIMLFDLAKLDEVRHARFALAVRTCLQTKSCRGVLIKIGENSPSWVQAEDWTRWIRLLRVSGKRSFVYASSYDEITYALAAGADGVYVFPGGGVKLRGVSSHRFFFAKLFQNLGIEADFVAVGTYKSAPEMWMRHSSSKPAEQQEKILLQSRDELFKSLCLQRPGMTLQRLDQFQKKMEIDAATAFSESLVDGQLYADQVPAAVFRKLGAVVGIANAENIQGTFSRHDDFIALLVFEGEIVSSRPLLPNPLTGMEVIELKKAATALLAAAHNPRVKAIVVRISSPGGSATASEALWRVVQQVSLRKPVVVSVGDMAASGGYYLAAGARRIVAGGGSWIGSIGVFGGKFQVEKLLQKWGVDVTTQRRAPMADAQTPWRPYTDKEREALRESLENTYQRFVKAVASGRKFTYKAALRRADGRVMPGFTALREGLIDDAGSLLDAITLAAREGGLSARVPVMIVYPPPDPAWKNLVLKAFSEVQPGSNLSFFASLFTPSPWMLWLDSVAP